MQVQNYHAASAATQPEANSLPNSKPVGSGGDAAQSVSGQSLLTLSEVCAKLRVSKWTVYRLIQSRHIPTIRIGARRLVVHSALETLLSRLTDEEASL